MARRGLNNFLREECVYAGQNTWRLLTREGTPVSAFDIFCRKNLEYSASTQKRYAEVAARFIDYLFEAGVFDAPTRPERLNAVVDAYPALLRDGSADTASRVRRGNTDAWLSLAAERLDWSPLAPKSFDNTMAAVNRFLRLSESLSREAAEKSRLLNTEPEQAHVALFEALKGHDRIGSHEVAAMKQYSMFGSVAKFAPRGIQRPRRLRTPAGSSSSSLRTLDFPKESLTPLIDAAQNWRDKSLWLMLAATGIRMSEALNLELGDVDLEGQRVYVFDPRGRRPSMSDGDSSRLRFKGRDRAHTYFIPELREALFQAIDRYLKLEFVPHYAQGQTPYFFQCMEPTKRGLPLVDVSHGALTQNFKRALKAANILPPQRGKDYVLHSLRHMYGVYMVNDYPFNPQLGLFGLPIVDVQMMMGHTSIRTTAHYARAKHRRLEAKLALSDQEMMGMSSAQLQALSAFNPNKLVNP